MRHEARISLDRHAARAFDGRSWVSIQRQPAGGYFDEIQGRVEYFSPAHMVHGEVAACVESSLRPWWVHISDGIPDERWPRAIIFNVVETVLSWLARLVPSLEERYTALPSGPVTLQFRFPDIETFGQREVGLERTPGAPDVAVEHREIVVDCHPRYLQSFLAPGNLGDRLMLAAMARGLEALCGSEPLPESAMEEWVRSVAGSDNDRFLKMRTSRTPNDLV